MKDTDYVNFWECTKINLGFCRDVSYEIGLILWVALYNPIDIFISILRTVSWHILHAGSFWEWDRRSVPALLVLFRERDHWHCTWLRVQLFTCIELKARSVQRRQLQEITVDTCQHMLAREAILFIIWTCATNRFTSQDHLKINWCCFYWTMKNVDFSVSDRPGAKYQPGPGPGDHFLAGAGAGVLFLAGAGDFWCFSPTIFEII